MHRCHQELVVLHTSHSLDPHRDIVLREIRIIQGLRTVSQIETSSGLPIWFVLANTQYGQGGSSQGGFDPDHSPFSTSEWPASLTYRSSFPPPVETGRQSYPHYNKHYMHLYKSLLYSSSKCRLVIMIPGYVRIAPVVLRRGRGLVRSCCRCYCCPYFRWGRGYLQSSFVPKPLIRPSDLGNGDIGRVGGGVSNPLRIVPISHKLR